MPTKVTVPSAGINVPDLLQLPDLEATLFGRFWVTPEVPDPHRCPLDNYGNEGQHHRQDVAYLPQERFQSSQHSAAFVRRYTFAGTYQRAATTASNSATRFRNFSSPGVR